MPSLPSCQTDWITDQLGINMRDNGAFEVGKHPSESLAACNERWRCVADLVRDVSAVAGWFLVNETGPGLKHLGEGIGPLRAPRLIWAEFRTVPIVRQGCGRIPKAWLRSCWRPVSIPRQRGSRSCGLRVGPG
jgi:hypothetical protein